MRSAVVFTSTLSPKVMNWLNAYSKDQKITKREVIEQAILLYKENLIKKEMAASFQQAANDQEILEIAEEGMEEYHDQIKSYES